MYVYMYMHDVVDVYRGEPMVLPQSAADKKMKFPNFTGGLHLLGACPLYIIHVYPRRETQTETETETETEREKFSYDSRDYFCFIIGLSGSFTLLGLFVNVSHMYI